MLYRNLFPGGKRKALTFSYDDGIAGDFRLAELLRKYGMKGTFNVNSGLMLPEGAAPDSADINRRLKGSEILEACAGFEIAAHGCLHPFYDRMPSAAILRDVLRDRELLERLTGGIVRGMAYPYGVYNETVIRALEACGICYCRTVEETCAFSLPENFLVWHPTCHHRNPRLQELTERFLQPPQGEEPLLFTIWGHTFELNNDANWEVLEQLCAQTAGRDDIWYATNLEIYTYVEAQNALVCSADGQLLQNPSALEVWVSADGEALSIPPGGVLRRQSR